MCATPTKAIQTDWKYTDENTKKKKVIAVLLVRFVSAVLTLLLMWSVRPDPEPSRWQVAFVTLLLYEGLRLAIEMSNKMDKQEDDTEKGEDRLCG